MAQRDKRTKAQKLQDAINLQQNTVDIIVLMTPDEFAQLIAIDDFRRIIHAVDQRLTREELRTQ